MNNNILSEKIFINLLWVALLIGAIWSSSINYIFFHFIAEIACIIISCSIFLVSWHSSKFAYNSFCTIIGPVFLCVGFVDLLHTLAFVDVIYIPEMGKDLTAQFWMVARFLQAGGLLAAIMLANKSVRPDYAMFWAISAMAVLLGTVYFSIFPRCFLEGVGITPFKTGGEYAVCVVQAFTIYLLHWGRTSFDDATKRLLTWALVLFIASELCFTLYLSLTDFAYLGGHILKLIGFYFLYRTIILASFEKPYSTLFRDWEKSEENHKNIVERMNEGVLGCDYNSMITLVNQSLCDMLGYSRQELVGNNIFNYLDSEQSRIFQEQLLLRRQATIDSYELTWTNRGGGKYVTILNPSYLFDKAGKFSGSIAVVTDITERKMIEQSLEQSEKQLRAIFDHAPIGVAIVDADANTSMVNNEMCSILEYDKKTLTSLSFAKLTHPDDVEADLKLFQELMEGKRDSYMLEQRYITGAGKTRWGRLSASAVRGWDGKPLYAICMVADVTKQVAAEEELLRAKNEWEMTFNTVQDMIAILDTSQNIVRANKQLATVLGVEQDELTGKNILEVLYGGSIPPSDSPTMQLLKDGKIHQAEMYEKQFNGYYQMSATPLVSEQGQIIGSIQMARNIDDRKKAELRLETILDIMNVYIMEPDLNLLLTKTLNIIQDRTDSTIGFIGYINENEELEIPTLTNGLLEQCPIKEFGTTLPKETWKDMCGKALRTKKTIFTNSPRKVPSGHVAIDRAVCVPILFKNQLAGEISVANKQTDYNEDDVRLLEEIALSMASPLTSRIKLDRHERMLSDSAVILSSRVKELDCLYNASTVMTNPDASEVDVFTTVFKSLEPAIGEMDVYGIRINVHGVEYTTDFWQESPWAYRADIAVAGADVGFIEISFSNDYKQHKNLSIASGRWSLLHALAELISTYLLRKKVESDLVIAKDAAEMANKAKSGFLASMSHELRTPLNAVIGFSEVLQDKFFGPLTDKQEEYIKDILESGQHLLSLINDILDLSKVEAGRLEFVKEEFDLNELLESCLTYIREKAFKHGISLQFEPDNNLQPIKADERRIKQVIFNLLSNSTKFTPDGGSIRMSSRKIEKNMVLSIVPNAKELTVGDYAENDWCLVSIEDTGIGLAPDEINAVFEEFRQLSDSITGKTPGTGLGLSLSKRFIEEQGGRLWAFSEGKGKGCIFSFVLPMIIRSKK
ncbi:MASE3 domain-containing protein [Desulfovibrio gilichinskyi]|uniref:histidine kinase n=1 Tax=Desulfovibrio gilichinskyi TaxID=1519643 RepID=A0A1X7EX60_9BACT|nr:MASE3 domain-containing protein [Desulfovibrio gilichinskyi]SMF41735.1 PAS domain S-box-containing protein [Desulfovibrio gilichinskyi]